jgi:hypothetical protein
MAAPRRRLGRWSNPGSHGQVYLTDAAIEIDEHDSGHIERRRVFLDDIVLITLHRSRSWLGFWTLACLAISFLLLGGIVARAASATSTVMPVFGVIACPFALFALLYLRPFAVVTVVGRRSRTRLSWWFAHGRAAAVHRELCQLALARTLQQPAAPADTASA